MAYNNFTLDSVKNQFRLRIFNDPFCDDLAIAEPQSEFVTVFSDLFKLGQSARTEKAKSELLVAPILVQARKLAGERVQLFSGEEFNVDQASGLNGFCDFLFSKSENPYTIDAPVLMMVEAKRGEIEFGWGQCVAEMFAAQTYNQNQEQNIPVVYGCVTSGRLWQFLKLEGDRVTIDPNNYALMPLEKILGILKWVLTQ
jgi:hypothetical protein